MVPSQKAREKALKRTSQQGITIGQLPNSILTVEVFGDWIDFTAILGSMMLDGDTVFKKLILVQNDYTYRELDYKNKPRKPTTKVVGTDIGIKGATSVEVIKLESGSGITLRINGNTIFASDNTSYWMQNNKLIRDDGVCQRGVENIKEALAIILLKYGGIKGKETETTRILERMFAADGVLAKA